MLWEKEFSSKADIIEYLLFLSIPAYSVLYFVTAMISLYIPYHKSRKDAFSFLIKFSSVFSFFGIALGAFAVVNVKEHGIVIFLIVIFLLATFFYLSSFLIGFCILKVHNYLQGTKKIK